MVKAFVLVAGGRRIAAGIFAKTRPMPGPDAGLLIEFPPLALQRLSGDDFFFTQLSQQGSPVGTSGASLIPSPSATNLPNVLDDLRVISAIKKLMATAVP